MVRGPEEAKRSREMSLKGFPWCVQRSVSGGWEYRSQPQGWRRGQVVRKRKDSECGWRGLSCAPTPAVTRRETELVIGKVFGDPAFDPHF